MRSRFFLTFALPLTAITLLGSGCVRVTSSSLNVGAKADAMVAPATAKTDRQALLMEVQKLVDDQRFANAHWGILIESLETGEVWYEHNADRLFIPASNQKIPTSAAALMALGPDFRYTTTISHTGTLSSGRLDGDLVIFGTGDPTHYTRWRDDARDDFRDWARILKSQGITEITGNVIGDDNAWDDTHVGSGWPFDDLTPWYYAEYGALNFNENYVDIEVVPPTSLDGTVQLIPNVPSAFYTLVPTIQVIESGSSGISLSRPHFSNVISVNGRVVAGAESFEVTPTITNPTLFHATVFREVLLEEGIRVVGAAVDCDDLPNWNRKADELPILHEHQSAPLKEIVAMLFKRSQNMYSEVMVYTMGWNATGKGTFGNGRRVVEEKLATLGVEPGTYRYADGSGLSRYNYLSPRIVNKINRGMRQSDLGATWYDIQSIAGVDGTLRNRMRDTAASNNLRGKTGTLSSVRALSGFVTTAAGEELLFSTMVNGHLRTSADTDSISDGIALLLAEFEGR